MNAYGTDQIAKFLVRLKVNGHLSDTALSDLVITLEQAARSYATEADPVFRADNGQPPLPATIKAITDADATTALDLYESLTNELCVLIAITEGPNTGGTDGIDDMNIILEAAIADGYIDANAINYPALKKQMDGTDRPDIAADPGK